MNKPTGPLRPSRHPTELELRAYLRGEESAYEQNQLEAHLLTCDACTAAVREIDEKRRTSHKKRPE